MSSELIGIAGADRAHEASRDVAIRLEGVSKAYQIYDKPEDRLKQILFGKWKTYHRDYWALADIDFEVRRGEAVGIVGRNGAGKSTLLQVITSILQPTSGTVGVNGRIAPLLQLGTSFNPEFSGIENIDLSASILGLNQDEIENTRGSIIEFAELGDFIRQPVRTYSSGMYARLAFAVAAHVRADILIVDEVLSVGDIGFTQKCSRFLRDFREGGTLLFVSHDIGAVLSLCDRAVWLDRGRIVEDAEPKRIVPHYSAWIANPEKDDARSYVERIRNSEIVDPADATERAQGAPAPESATTASPAPPPAIAGQPETLMRFDGFRWNARSYGAREGSIVDAWFANAGGERVAVVNGGDTVTLYVKCTAATDLYQPIIGFAVLDRLGVTVFAWDTSKEGRFDTVHVAANDEFTASFTFAFPYLGGGEYTTIFALATGTETQNRHQHWIYEPIAIHVAATRLVQGLIGVPMLDVGLSLRDGNTD